MYGVLIVIALYLAINAVYIYAVPVTEMKGALRMSEVATTALFGYKTSAWITGIITISILGALNVVTMIGPRIYYAMAKDGVFFTSSPMFIPNFGTPTKAILLQALWSCLLILTNTWGTLFTYVSVVITLFSAFTVGSVIVLRYQAAGTQAALSALGLSAGADTFCPGSSVDRLGLGDGKAERIADWARHRLPGHSGLFDLAQDERRAAEGR